MIDFSLIIPVYNNSEIELLRCVNSIDNQTFRNFEVIIVDDGSNSECSKLLDTLENRYSYIRVFHKFNGGVSDARNVGINLSKGKYITFIDADDFISPVMLEEALPYMEKYSLDILYGLVFYVQKDTLKIFERTRNPEIILLNTKLKKKLINHMFNIGEEYFWREKAYVSRGPYAKILKRDVCLDNLFNIDLKFGEDEDFNFRLLRNNRYSIGVIFSCWYYYLFNNESSLHKYRSDFVEESEKRLNVLRQNIIDDINKRALMLEGFTIVRELFYRYYLSPEYPRSFLCCIKEFNSLIHTSPWKDIFKFYIAKDLGFKNLMKFLLLYSGIYPILFYCKKKYYT